MSSPRLFALVHARIPQLALLREVTPTVDFEGGPLPGPATTSQPIHPLTAGSCMMPRLLTRSVRSPTPASGRLTRRALCGDTQSREGEAGAIVRYSPPGKDTRLGASTGRAGDRFGPRQGLPAPCMRQQSAGRRRRPGRDTEQSVSVAPTACSREHPNPARSTDLSLSHAHRRRATVPPRTPPFPGHRRVACGAQNGTSGDSQHGASGGIHGLLPRRLGAWQARSTTARQAS